MDTSFSPEYPAELPVTQLARPARSWACPWYVSASVTALVLAAVIASMHFVVRPMAAHHVICPAPVAACHP